MLRAALVVGLIAAAAPAMAETRKYEFKDFKKIEISSLYDVELVQGPKYSVEIESFNNNFDWITAKQAGDTLRIGRPRGHISKPLHDMVRITAPDINEVNLSAVVTLSTKSLHVRGLKLALEAASRINAEDLQVDDLMVKVKSGSAIRLAGQCKTAFVQAEAGAVFKAGSLACSEVGIEAQAGSSVDVRADDKVYALARQGSMLSVSGDPKTFEKFADRGSFIKATSH